jgi:hypothetical protein
MPASRRGAASKSKTWPESRLRFMQGRGRLLLSPSSSTVASRAHIGAVQSWARGSKAHVVSMLMTLIGADRGFSIEAEVRERLAGEPLIHTNTEHTNSEMCC